MNTQPQNPNLIETTTSIQAKRGNRQFFDQKHKVSYITYANGYVRREINAEHVTPYNGKTRKRQDQHPINKRKTTKHTYYLETNSNGIKESYDYYTTCVVLEHCPQARMDMIDRLSTNYKGYTGRFLNPRYRLIVR